MHYIIDGYNLMFRTLRANDDLQTQRESIIRDLNAKIHIVNLDVTIVFDAHYQKGESSRSHLQHLEIFFTEHGQTADEWILNYLKHEKKPQQQIVITSDKKLAWQSRRKGAHTLTIEDFLKELNQRYKNKLKQQTISPKLIQSKKIEKINPVIKTISKPKNEYDYYLEQFEIRSKELAESAPQKSLLSKKKYKKRKIAEKEDCLSNIERWKKAFERHLEDEDFS